MAKPKKEINISIGEHVKAAREASGYTQEQFAEAIGVSIQYVSDVERGVVGTSIPTLVKICSTLNISSDYILFGESGETSFTLNNRRYDNLTKTEITYLEKLIGIYLEGVRHL